MGEEWTDMEINLAQWLLMEQFAHINGLQSTLQEKCPTKKQKNKLHIFCKKLKALGDSN